MESFIFTAVKSCRDEDLMKGCFIIVWQVKRVPPHLMIAYRGKTWSISVTGQQPGEPLDKLLSAMHRKKVPVIFSEWKLPGDLSEEQFRSILDTCTLRYPAVEAGRVSCLAPLRDAAAEIHGDEFRQARFIFELLPLLKNSGALGHHYGFYLGQPDGSDLLMPVYGAADVDNATREAQRTGDSGN